MSAFVAHKGWSLEEMSTIFISLSNVVCKLFLCLYFLVKYQVDKLRSHVFVLSFCFGNCTTVVVFLVIKLYQFQ